MNSASIIPNSASLIEPKNPKSAKISQIKIHFGDFDNEDCESGRNPNLPKLETLPKLKCVLSVSDIDVDCKRL